MRAAVPKAVFRPRISFSRHTGSCMKMRAPRAAACCSSATTAGEVVAPVRIAVPARPAANRGCAQAAKAAQSVSLVNSPPRRSTFWLRPLSYRSSTLACANTLVAPALSGWSGLPSILIGRPS